VPETTEIPRMPGARPGRLPARGGGRRRARALGGCRIGERGSLRAAGILAAVVLAIVGAPPRRARGAGLCQSPAEQGSAQGPLELVVGYADTPPLAWNADGKPHEPVGLAADVLRLLARRNGWRLKFHPFNADNVVANLAACKLDVGIVSQIPPRLWQRHQDTLDLTMPYFESVAVVALRSDVPDPVDETDPRQAGEARAARPVRPSRASAWTAAGVRAAGFGLLATAALVLLVSLVNLRMPSAPGRALPHRLRLVALDPALVGVRGATRWLRSARTGRVLVAVWFLSGFGLALAATPAESLPVDAGDRATHAAALRRSIHDVAAVGLRPGGNAIDCVDVVRCLQDLARGDLTALAGDAETLCHHLRAEHMESIRFEHAMMWPREHTFVVPPGGRVRRLLNAALGRTMAEDPEALAAIQRAYGVPWTAPLLAPGCPPGREAHR
jgi:ABC-type amino acid transport substrate-binding protein